MNLLGQFANLGPLGVVDRYYDPTTDQFMSVDPDVADTDQPYAFTGDDPLNAADPLGTSAIPKSDIEYDIRHDDICGSHGERKCVGAAFPQVGDGSVRGLNRYEPISSRRPVPLPAALSSCPGLGLSHDHGPTKMTVGLVILNLGWFGVWGSRTCQIGSLGW